MQNIRYALLSCACTQQSVSLNSLAHHFVIRPSSPGISLSAAQALRLSWPVRRPQVRDKLVTGDCRLSAHQLHQHDEQKRRGHESADEDALLIKVGLPGKRLTVFPQIGVDPLCIVHNSSCTQSQSCWHTTQAAGVACFLMENSTNRFCA